MPEDAADDAVSCIGLWNAVIVAFAQGHCDMLVPKGEDAALEFVARGGRGPWHTRGLVDVERVAPGALPEPNARPDADGMLTPIG